MVIDNEFPYHVLEKTWARAMWLKRL